MTRLIAFAALLPTLTFRCGLPAPKPGDRVVVLAEPVARLGDARFRHIAPIQKVVFRPDGKALAASGYWSTAVVEWDVATGRELRRYGDPGRQGFLIGYAAGGRRLAVCDYQRAALYDTATGRLAAEVETNRTVVLSPDGRSVLGRDPEKRLIAWDALTGEAVRTYPNRVSDNIAFSPDGRQLACVNNYRVESDPDNNGGPNEKSEVWVGPADGSGPGRVLTPPYRDARFATPTLIWARDDRLLVLRDGAVAVFDPGTGVRVAAADPFPDDLSRGFSAGGRFYLPRGGFPPAVEFDPDTLTVTAGGRNRLPPDAATSHSPDGSVRAEVRGQSVRLVDVKTGESVHPELDHQSTGPARTLAFSADGRRVLAGGRVWDVPDGGPADAAVRRRLPGGYDLALSADGRWAAATNDPTVGRRGVAVWDAATGFEEFRVPVEHPGAVGFDPAGRLWVQARGSVTSYEVPSGRAVQTIELPATAVSVVLSADGRKLAAAGWEVFAVRDTDPAAQWQVIETYPPRKRSCGSSRPPSPPLLGFTPDGSRLLTQEGIWDVTGKPVRVHKDGVQGYSVRFSPDGRRMVFRLATPRGDYDRLGPPLDELRVWDVATLTEIGRVPLPAGAAGFGIDPAGRLWLAHADTTLTVHPLDWAAFDPR